MDALVTILKWEKFNPRKDVKRPHWFALDNELVEDDAFVSFGHGEFKTWIYLLSKASKKQNPEIEVFFEAAHRKSGISPEEFSSALDKLEQLGIVAVVRTDSERVRTDSYAKNENAYATLHNITLQDTTLHNTTVPKKNARTGDQKTSGFIAAYCSRFLERYGSNPLIDGRTAGIAKRLAKNMGEDRAILLLDAFFQMPDAELVKTKHPLSKFEFKLNEITVFADSGNFTTRKQEQMADESLSNAFLLKQVREGKI